MFALFRFTVILVSVILLVNGYAEKAEGTFILHLMLMLQ